MKFHGCNAQDPGVLHANDISKKGITIGWLHTLPFEEKCYVIATKVYSPKLTFIAAKDISP